MRYLLTAIFIAVFQVLSFAQDPILIRAQQQRDRQKELMKNLVYSYNTVSYICQLDKTGLIEKSDTVISWHKLKGDSLLESRIISATNKKHQKEQGQSNDQENIELPKFNDPKYEFSVNQADGRITFKPVKPKKGDLAGTVRYSPDEIFLQEINITMPKLKGPVNEFNMKVEFTRIEEFLFPSKICMQAGWNALISKGRIRVESSNSDYQIYK